MAEGGSVELPAALQTFFKVTLGMTWPEANVGNLRVMSGAWKVFAQQLAEIGGGVGSVPAALDRSMDGEYAEAMGDWFSGRLIPSIDDLRDAAEAFAKMAKSTAANVEKSQIMMIMFALLALASVIELLASIIFAWMAAAVELAAQVTIRMIWQALVRKIASITGAQVAKAAGTAVIDMASFAAMGAGLMVVVDGVTQGAQMAKGVRDKDDFDAESLGKSAIGGAIGGGAAGLTHSVARVAVMGARDAAKTFGKEVPGWLAGVGHGGYAVAQIAAVAWSNPIVNIAVDS
ncbi:WXG100-like domain-containing protein, partial [Amycolatopsis speibonae]